MTSLGSLMARRSIPETQIDKLWTSATILSNETNIPVELALDEQNSYHFSEENT